MSRVLVSVNILDNVNAQVYGSHCQEWFRLGRTCPKDDFILFHPNRFSIDNARNQAATYALMYECDYIYFIDDDMILSPNTFISLRNADADIAQALTFIRNYPFNCMAFKKIEPGKMNYFNDYTEHINDQGLIECEAVGFACVLIKTELLRKIQPPYFVTSSGTTEDVYFCVKVRQKLGSDVRIVVDSKVPTGHLLHPQTISAHNRNEMLEHYAKFDIDGRSEDRGKEYLEQCKQVFSLKSLVS